MINIKFIISQFLLLYTSSKNRKLFLERERANILLQDGGIETWPKKEKRIIFRDPSGSKRHHGLITIHRISQNFSSFFFPRPVSVRGTGKIKVRLSSQYCERGTNEIRAASGRISSFELARNSSRLYLLGAAPPKGEHNESLRIIKTFPVFSSFFFFFYELYISVK